LKENKRKSGKEESVASRYLPPEREKESRGKGKKDNNPWGKARESGPDRVINPEINSTMR